MSKFKIFTLVLFLVLSLSVSGVIVYGILTAEPATVTFDSNGGSKVENIDADVGDALELPENPTRDGYVFVGWLIDDNNYATDGMIINGNMNLKAVWIHLDHVYDNSCDNECNVEDCKALRDAGHVFDHACDTTCNVSGCGYTRKIEHVFDHDCDTMCNIKGCGYIRETVHVFDNECDSDCNVKGCGYICIPIHKFDSVCDTVCNVAGCGYTREVPHVYSSVCDTFILMCAIPYVITKSADA